MILYMVLKLLTEIEYIDPITKKATNIKLGDCEGYVPVFKTEKEAKKHAQKGKYQIGVIKV